MNEQCAVPGCVALGEHSTDDDTTMCLRHACEWDDSSDERLRVLASLYMETPGADNEVVWAEMRSRWLGERQ